MVLGVLLGLGPRQASAAETTLDLSISYQDKDIGPTGFTGTVTVRPSRGVTVELWRGDLSELLATAAADATGRVALTFDEPTSPSVEVVAIALAEIAFEEGDRIRVFDHPSTLNLYAAQTAPVTLTAGATTPASLLVLADSPGDFQPGGMFHVVDWALTVRERLRLARPGGVPVKNLDVFTGPGINATFFVNLEPDARIVLWGGDAGGRGDTDFYDDTVLIHELGHHNGSLLGVDNTFGGLHSLTARIDPRLAFSEGWGTFFAGWITGSSVYIDTGDTVPGSAFVFDFEPPNFSSDLVRANNEGAVLAAMWDLYDGAGGAADADSDGADLAAGIARLIEQGIDQQNSTIHFEPIVARIAEASAGPTDDDALLAALRERVIEFAPLADVEVEGWGDGSLYVFPPENEGPFDFALPVASALSRRITSIAVNVEMTNPPPQLLRNEFRLDLLAPDGASYMLRDFVTDDRAGIMAWFGEPTWAAPADSFTPLDAARLEGTWTLRVTRRRTQGVLNPLRLHHFRLFVTSDIVGASDGIVAR
jgi:hypothetical protein